MGQFRVQIGPKGSNPGPGSIKMAQIQSQIPEMGRFRLKIVTRSHEMARIQAQDPLEWPNSSLRSPKWADLGPKLAQIQAQDPQKSSE